MSETTVPAYLQSDPAMAEGRLAIGGFSVHDSSYEQAKQVISESLRSRRNLAIFFANTHLVTMCQNLLPQFKRHPSVYILNDGIGLNLAAYLVHRRWFSRNMNGTDFVPHFLRETDRPVRVFLLGSSPAAVAGAAETLRGYACVSVAGFCDGYSCWTKQEAVIAEINATKADIVLVAFGTPKQERWILDNWRRVDAPVLLAVGALFDFLSQEQPRAPLWMRRLNLEWFFRLCNEPRRLFYRYTVELVNFFRIVLAHGRVAADAVEASQGGIRS